MSQYTFGDNGLAARRLRIIAEVFRESTASALSLVEGADFSFLPADGREQKSATMCLSCMPLPSPRWTSIVANS